MINKNFWRNRKIFLTGHTGFKGSWMLTWLKELGCDVCGYALEPEKNSLFNYLFENEKKEFKNIYGDINNKEYLRDKILEFKPEIVFHFAAQPLVLESYLSPLKTWQTNLMGTLNLLESLKNYDRKCTIIIITTDKVYKNKECNYAYMENDELGGYDPYSASKAATEIAVESWKQSFIGESLSQNNLLSIATARSGNVVGGGDWSKNRILPDAVNSIINNKDLIIRNPNSTRPWQHVLEPLGGYLLLAQKVYENPELYSGAFNFGPELNNNKTVEELINEVFKSWKGTYKKQYNSKDAPHEAKILNLDIQKSHKYLNWYPLWNFEFTIKKTIMWYKNFYAGKNPMSLCKEDLKSYLNFL